MTDIATLSIQVKADGTAKVVKGLDDVKSAAIGAEGAAGNTSKTMKSLDSQLLKTAKAFGAFVSVGAVITALTSVTKQAAAFESAMREVSTLTNSIDMTKLTRQVEGTFWSIWTRSNYPSKCPISSHFSRSWNCR
jgi:hypothetical protein